LTSVQFVFGKPPVLKSRESIVIAGDEPRCLAIREFHGEYGVLGPELRIKRKGFALNCGFEMSTVFRALASDALTIGSALGS
jgi:hypothetical protein